MNTYSSHIPAQATVRVPAPVHAPVRPQVHTQVTERKKNERTRPSPLLWSFLTLLIMNGILYFHFRAELRQPDEGIHTRIVSPPMR